MTQPYFFRIFKDPTTETVKTVIQIASIEADLNNGFCSWWRMTGSNRRPPACKAGALPAELIPPRPSISVAMRRCSSACIERLCGALSRLAWLASRSTGPATTSRCYSTLVCENQAGQGGTSRRIRIGMQARRQRRHAPVIADQWWVWMGSNHRPPPYQDGALTS